MDSYSCGINTSQESLGLGLSQEALEEIQAVCPENVLKDEFWGVVHLGLTPQNSEVESDTMVVKQEPVDQEEVGQSSSDVYTFSVVLPPQKSSAKNAPWSYSPELQKMFVLSDQRIPFEITCSPKFPFGCTVRAWLEFSNATNKDEVVVRCPRHMIADPAHEVKEHILRSQEREVKYEMVNTSPEQYCVVTPLPTSNMRGSVSKCSLLYSFACLGSCPGGINRRPTKIVFQFEHGSNILAVNRYDIKICSCPQRDMLTESMRLKGVNKQPSSEKKSILGRHTSSDDENSTTVFIVRGAKNSKLVQKALEKIKLPVNALTIARS